jgi:hypothetical protein
VSKVVIKIFISLPVPADNVLKPALNVIFTVKALVLLWIQKCLKANEINIILFGNFAMRIQNFIK